jgi:hypothetical protein
VGRTPRSAPDAPSGWIVSHSGPVLRDYIVPCAGEFLAEFIDGLTGWRSTPEKAIEQVFTPRSSWGTGRWSCVLARRRKGRAPAPPLTAHSPCIYIDLTSEPQLRALSSGRSRPSVVGENGFVFANDLFAELRRSGAVPASPAHVKWVCFFEYGLEFYRTESVGI